MESGSAIAISLQLQQGSAQFHNVSNTRMVIDCVWLLVRVCDHNAFAILA